jgi:glycosyltransferase involved in cell wall biosynthesis
MSFGAVAALTRAPRAVQRLGVAAARQFPELAASVGRAIGRTQGRTMHRRDIDDRFDAARTAVAHIDMLVAPSRSMAHQFERLGFDAARIRVSDYGFVPLLPRPRSAATGPLRIGYAGTLVWHKGVHLLLDAVRQLPPDSFELKVFGNTNVFPAYRAELGARAHGLPVRFMGQFDREHTADVYAQIDVLVVPSLWLENSPLVIHEAFMAGVPVVGANIGGIADLVDDGRNGLLFEPGSADALASILRTLAADRERLAALTGVPSAVKSIARDAEEWDAAYAHVVGARQQTRHDA